MFSNTHFKNIALSLVAVWAFTAQTTSARNYSIEEISIGWSECAIQVKKAAKNPDIIMLVKAFDGQWSTTQVGAALSGQNATIDSTAGVNDYLHYGNDKGAITARLWTGDEDAWLAIYLTDDTDEDMFLYRYVSSERILTPEQGLLSIYSDALSQGNELYSQNVSYSLPEKGNELTVIERIDSWGPMFAVTHTFVFDGNGFSHKHTHLNAGGAIAMLEQIYEEHEEENVPDEPYFSQMALIDIDDDDCPELWLRNANGQDGAVFSMVDGNIKLIMTEYEPLPLHFYPGHVGRIYEDTNGTRKFEEYVTVKESQPDGFIGQSTDDYGGNVGVLTETYVDGEKVDNSVWSHFKAGLGREVTPYCTWLKLVK